MFEPSGDTWTPAFERDDVAPHSVALAACHRLATARIQILSQDAGLSAALREVNEAGQALRAYWRRGNAEETEYRSRRDRYRTALRGFVEHNSRVIGKRPERP